MKLAMVNDVVYDYASGAPWAVGGAELQQWLVARTLAAAGWSVAVGVRRELAPMERRTIGGIEFVGIGRGQIMLEWYRFLQATRPDWLYWRSADHMWGPSVEMAKLAGVRTIFSAASDRDVQPRHAIFRRHRWWPLYAWGLSRNDRIFVQHGGQLARLSPRRRSKAYVVPNIAGEPVDAKPHSERAKYVAWVGELRQVKRPDLLIEIACKMPAVRFVVCGGINDYMSPPRYGARMVEQMQGVPNIDYLGPVAPAKARQCIADAAILLSTSDSEGFPNTFLEAWSSGTPVISLRADVESIIDRRGLGAVSGSVDGAVSSIQALVVSPQRREEIAARARTYVVEAHSKKAFIAAFERALRNGHL